MSILGTRVVRREDPRFLTVGGTYIDDIPIEGAVWVTYVRSTIAHARITAVDVDAARGAPGVVAVFTGHDVDLAPRVNPMPVLTPGFTRHWLATERVRYVGDPIVAIVTEERYQGPDAADLVIVDYDPLPAIVSPEEAVRDEVLLFPEVGTNVCANFHRPSGDVAGDVLFEGCEVVVRQRMVNQRVAPCPLEPRAAIAAWIDGRLTQWACTQAPNYLVYGLCGTYGLTPDQVRVITPDVGGGFGAKFAPCPEEVLLGWLARAVGRPVRWVETRTESMLNMGHGRAQTQYVTLGGTADGEIQAYRLELLGDVGAYAEMGAFLPYMTQVMTQGVYEIPKVEFVARSVLTNTTPTVAYRGAGRPEAANALERIVDRYAREIGMDPAEVRRKNLIPSSAFPYTTRVGTVYDCGDYERSLDLALEAVGYEAVRAEQARRVAAGDTMLLGLGLATYVEITNAQVEMPDGSKTPLMEFSGVEITPEGTAIIRAGTLSHGQGHATAFAMIVADKLGIPIDDVELRQGDTDEIPFGGGTAGSRSLQMAGPAIIQASDAVREQAKELAAELLEASPDDVVLDTTTGRFHVAGTPSVARSWADLGSAAAVRAEKAAEAGDDTPPILRADITYNGLAPSFPFGTQIAVVEIDSETGKVRLDRFVAVDDSGTILNPLIADGQRHGGIAQGVAQALCEEVRYDDDGNPLTTNFADYTIISAPELPDYEIVDMETPTPLNPLGAKGIGESGAIGATVAVQNAVVDALAHLGVTHLDTPCTPEKVWLAIQEAGA